LVKFFSETSGWIIEQGEGEVTNTIVFRPCCS